MLFLRKKINDKSANSSKSTDFNNLQLNNVEFTCSLPSHIPFHRNIQRLADIIRFLLPLDLNCLATFLFPIFLFTFITLEGRYSIEKS